MTHSTVCVCQCVCQCVCVINVCLYACWVLFGGGSYLRYVMDGGRERRAHVSPWQPTCLWPFIKPGVVEEREGLTVTDRALCGTRGGPCCLLTETALHAQRQNGASMQTASVATQQVDLHRILFFFFTSCAFHTGPRRQVAMPTDDTQPPQPPPPRVTHRHRETCSSIRQTGPNAERLEPNWEWSRTHWECESGRGQPAAGVFIL